MKHLLASLTLFVSLAVSAQETAMANAEVAALAKQHVPKGWKVIATAKGDLNKDAADDIALVIENTDAANMMANPIEGAQPKTFNINPRHLLVLFKSGSGYTLQAKNESFIPPQDSPDMPCLADPFVDSGGVDIVKGSLIISMQTFMSCGGWDMTNELYTLRYQDSEFKLIGYDSHSHHRASGEVTEVSINYLTKKKSTTTGGNMFDEAVNKPKTTWDKIKINQLITLSDLNADTEIDY
jgi:hypothetical protein